MPFRPDGRGRFVLVVAGLCVIVAIVGWSADEGRRTRHEALTRHAEVMSLQREIRANQAILQQSEDATAEWRETMRTKLERVEQVLDRLEPILILLGGRRPASEQGQ
jgi:hypothetical protein